MLKNEQGAKTIKPKMLLVSGLVMIASGLVLIIIALASAYSLVGNCSPTGLTVDCPMPTWQEPAVDGGLVLLPLGAATVIIAAVLASTQRHRKAKGA